ncbi:MAG: DUF3108 domain-containing protein [Bauldia sp.]
MGDMPPIVSSGARGKGVHIDPVIYKKQGLSLAAIALAVVAGAGESRAADVGTLSASYTIAISGFPVGRVDAQSRFDGAYYSLAITGSTSGLSRLVSDATATLTGSGRVSGTQVVPLAYSLDTTENGEATHVRMTMNGGRVTALSAYPDLAADPRRIPVTTRFKTNVVDPVSAFVIPTTSPDTTDGNAVCNRVMPIFDGWQRFDLNLYFKERRTVSGTGGSYSGPVFVCGARYVAVAGHVPDRDSVRFMEDNRNLEVWLAPVEHLKFLVPYYIKVGTRVGDLTIAATRFTAAPEQRQAGAN